LVAFAAASPFRETTLLEKQVGEGVSPTLDVRRSIAHTSKQVFPKGSYVDFRQRPTDERRRHET
jgi:hypothetical protein